MKSTELTAADLENIANKITDMGVDPVMKDIMLRQMGDAEITSEEYGSLAKWADTNKENAIILQDYLTTLRAAHRNEQNNSDLGDESSQKEMSLSDMAKEAPAPGLMDKLGSMVGGAVDGLKELVGMAPQKDIAPADSLECVPDDSNNLECVPVSDEKAIIPLPGESQITKPALACLPSEKAVVPTANLTCLPAEKDGSSVPEMACLPGGAQEGSLACLPAENQNMTPALVCKPDPACKPMSAGEVAAGFGLVLGDKPNPKTMAAELAKHKDEFSPQTAEKLKAWAEGGEKSDPALNKALKLELAQGQAMSKYEGNLEDLFAQAYGNDEQKIQDSFDKIHNAMGTDQFPAVMGVIHKDLEDAVASQKSKVPAGQGMPPELMAFEDNVKSFKDDLVAPLSQVQVEACSAAPVGGEDHGGMPGGSLANCLTPAQKQALLDAAAKDQDDFTGLKPGNQKAHQEFDAKQDEYERLQKLADEAKAKADEAKSKADASDKALQDAKDDYTTSQNVANSADNAPLCPPPPVVTKRDDGSTETTETTVHKDGSKTITKTIVLPGEGGTRVTETTTKSGKETHTKETITDGHGGGKTIETIILPGGETRIVEKTTKESKEVSSKETVTDGHGGGKATETITLPGGGTKVTETIIKESKEVSSKETTTDGQGGSIIIKTIQLPGGGTKITEETTKESKEVSSKETVTDGHGGGKTIETIILPGGGTKITETTTKESKEVSSKETTTDGHGGGKIIETITLPGGGTKLTETTTKESKEVSSKETVTDGHGGGKTTETIILPGGGTKVTETIIKENKETHTTETTTNKDGSSVVTKTIQLPGGGEQIITTTTDKNHHTETHTEFKTPLVCAPGPKAQPPADEHKTEIETKPNLVCTPKSEEQPPIVTEKTKVPVPTIDTKPVVPEGPVPGGSSTKITETKPLPGGGTSTTITETRTLPDGTIQKTVTIQKGSETHTETRTENAPGVEHKFMPGSPSSCNTCDEKPCIAVPANSAPAILYKQMQEKLELLKKAAPVGDHKAAPGPVSEKDFKDVIYHHGHGLLATNEGESIFGIHTHQYSQLIALGVTDVQLHELSNLALEGGITQSQLREVLDWAHTQNVSDVQMAKAVDVVVNGGGVESAMASVNPLSVAFHDILSQGDDSLDLCLPSTTVEMSSIQTIDDLFASAQIIEDSKGQLHIHVNDTTHEAIGETLTDSMVTTQDHVDVSYGDVKDGFHSHPTLI